MSPGNNKVLEDMRNRMTVQNRAKSTIEGYLYGVRQLALFTGKAFKQIHPEEVYAFLVSLHQDRGLSRNTMRIAVCGIKYLYKHFFANHEIVAQVPYPKQAKYLPEILTSNELRKLFNLTRNRKHRLFLKLTYSAGLRRSEVCNLLIDHIDSKNMQILVKKGKGDKDRYVPLSQNILHEARGYIKQYKPEKYLFNGKTKGQPLSEEATSWLMTQALERAGITKKVSLHNLRHSFASHLLSMGVNLLTIKGLLGHEDIRTTMVYLHISSLYQKPFTNPLDLMYPPSNNKNNG